MNRNDLLQHARQCKFSLGISVALAQRVTSVESIDRERERLLARADHIDRWDSWLGLGLAASIMVFAVSTLVQLLGPQLAGDLLAIQLGSALMAVATGISYTRRAVEHAEIFDDLLRLAPVMSADKRRLALEYVHAATPAVLKWRDLALAERGELYEFDISVMRDLHFASKAASEAARTPRVTNAPEDTRQSQINDQTQHPQPNFSENK